MSGASFKKLLITLLLFCLSPAANCLAAAAQSKSAPRDARGTVQSFFSLLKSQQYSSLYEFLPNRFQQQVTPAQLTQSLKRLNSQIIIDRLEVSRVQEKGDLAVVDTVIYGQLKKVIRRNGEELKESRISAQQFLFKEDGRWKIATIDNREREYFLRSHPEFSKEFQLLFPRFEVKQEGRWRPLGEAIKQ